MDLVLQNSKVTVCLVHLAGSVPAGKKRVSADQKLGSVRSQFIHKLSEPVLNRLLDELLQSEVITEGEMEDITAKGGRSDKARTLVDTVRKKGAEASSALINTLCEVDPCVSKDLTLKPKQYVARRPRRSQDENCVIL